MKKSSVKKSSVKKSPVKKVMPKGAKLKKAQDGRTMEGRISSGRGLTKEDKERIQSTGGMKGISERFRKAEEETSKRAPANTEEYRSIRDRVSPSKRYTNTELPYGSTTRYNIDTTGYAAGKKKFPAKVSSESRTFKMPSGFKTTTTPDKDEIVDREMVRRFIESPDVYRDRKNGGKVKPSKVRKVKISKKK